MAGDRIDNGIVAMPLGLHRRELIVTSKQALQRMGRQPSPANECDAPLDCAHVGLAFRHWSGCGVDGGAGLRSKKPTGLSEKLMR